MNNEITLKTVALTPELGMALKNFRIENKKTATGIIKKWKKASSYISKLENGDIKKIESDFLIDLCNYITGTENGLCDFLNKLSQSYKDFSNETKIIVMNIDDLLVEHIVPPKLITEINEYLSSHELSISQLVNKINANEDIADHENYSKLPDNVWYNEENDIDNVSIKLKISYAYIEDLLTGKISKTHRVVLEALLYCLYKLGKEDAAHYAAHAKLNYYKLIPQRSVVKVTDENFDSIFGGLEPDAADALKSVTSGLKLITTISKTGSKRIKQIADNMKGDLGFCFAYMAADLEALEKKDREKKTQFLKELEILIDKYSQDDTSIDLYE